MKQLSVYLALVVLTVACAAKPVRVPTPISSIKAEFKLKPVWVKDVGQGAGRGDYALSPWIADATLYVADYAGGLYALDRNNGHQLWQVQLPYRVSSGVGGGGGRLYTVSPDGEVVAVDAKDGSVVWHALVSSEALVAPVYSDNHLLVHTGDGKLFALDASNGRLLWTYDRSVPVLTLRGTSAPVVAQGAVFDSFDSGKLAVLQLATGNVLLEQALAIPQGRTDLDRMVDADAGPLLDNDVVYAATYQGRIVAMNLRAGRQLWSRKASIVLPMSADDRMLYATDSDDAIIAYDKQSGTPVWRQEALLARRLTAPLLVGDYLVVGDYQGYVHVLDKRDGHIVARHADIAYRLATGGGHGRLTVEHSREVLALQARPQLVGDTIYLYGHNGRVTALRLPGKK